MGRGKTSKGVAEIAKEMNHRFVHIEINGRRFQKDSGFAVQPCRSRHYVRLFIANQLQMEMEREEGRRDDEVGKTK